MPPEGRISFHFIHNGFFLTVFHGEIWSEKRVQAYVLVARVKRALGDEPVRNLSVEDAITVDPVVPHQGTCIFAEVMKNFDNVSILQNLLEAMREGVELSEVENEATVGA